MSPDNPLTAPFWEGAARHRLLLQRCTACRSWIHFPESWCPRCGASELRFEAVSGDGTVESFSVVHRSFVDGYADAPYVIAWVALPEQSGLRFFSNIVDCDPSAVYIGMPVQVTFEQRGDHRWVPQFRPRQVSGGDEK